MSALTESTARLRSVFIHAASSACWVRVRGRGGGKGWGEGYGVDGEVEQLLHPCGELGGLEGVVEVLVEDDEELGQLGVRRLQTELAHLRVRVR